MYYGMGMINLSYSSIWIQYLEVLNIFIWIKLELSSLDAYLNFWEEPFRCLWKTSRYEKSYLDKRQVIQIYWHFMTRAIQICWDVFGYIRGHSDISLRHSDASWDYSNMKFNFWEMHLDINKASGYTRPILIEEKGIQIWAIRMYKEPSGYHTLRTWNSSIYELIYLDISHNKH